MPHAIIAPTAEELTLDKVIPLMDGYKRIKASRTPLCVIKYGPPGSGKTSADAIIKKLLRINLTNFTKVDKDTPLTAIKSFRDESLRIKQQKQQDQDEAIVEMQQEHLEQKDKEGLSIIDKMPILLQRAFDYKLNVLWETTAQSHQSQKLLDRVFETIPKNYRIIVLFPIISIDTAKRRVLERAQAHLLNEPPYYRPVPVKQLIAATDNSHMYFMKEIMPRVLSGDIHQLYCYNNERMPLKTNFKTMRNRNVVAASVTRLAPDWTFGLDKRHRRIITRRLLNKNRSEQ
jgi:adenylate kinase family enzyme